jgi:hypothetical protein
LLGYGVTPPVITDEYWLDVVEASNRINAFGAVVPEEAQWDRWSFPLPPKDGGTNAWGDRLARTAMQVLWTKAADEKAISPVTPPTDVLNFIRSYPGLLDVCNSYPGLTAEYAPQLTIPGFGQELEPAFEEAYQKSFEGQQKLRAERSSSGSALTTSGLPPTCDEEWIFRDEALGEYHPDHVAYAYFHAEMFGPPVSPFCEAVHVVWLLSRASSWLPERIRAALIEGLRIGTLWFRQDDDNGSPTWKTHGALFDALYDAKEKKKPFKWTPASEDDWLHTIAMAVRRLSLPETPTNLFEAFKGAGFVEAFLARRERSSWENSKSRPRRKSRFKKG